MISIIGAGAKSIKNILKKLESPLGINKAESTAVINKIINIFFFETIKSFKINKNFRDDKRKFTELIILINWKQN